MTERLLSLIDAMPGHRAVVVGDYMLDVYWEGEADRLSPEAPVPVVRIDPERVRHYPGGAGNVVRGLETLAICCAAGGAIGDDDDARQLMSLPEWRDADTVGLLRLPRRRTVRKARVMARGQQIVRLDWEERIPISDHEAEQIIAKLRPALSEADVLVICDFNKGTLTPSLTRPLIRQAREAGKIVVVDPRPANMDNYRGATVVTPNESEAATAAGIRITDRGTLERCGRELLSSLDAQAVLVTRGSRGVSLFQAAEGPRHIPAVPAEVYDTTGAGDMVTVMLAGALAAGASLFEAAVLGNIAASIVIRHWGCYAVTPEELRGAVAGGGAYLQTLRA